MYTHIKEIIYQNRIKIETEIYKKVLVRFNIHLSRNELFLIKVLIDNIECVILGVCLIYVLNLPHIILSSLLLIFSLCQGVCKGVGRYERILGFPFENWYNISAQNDKKLFYTLLWVEILFSLIYSGDIALIVTCAIGINGIKINAFIFIMNCIVISTLMFLLGVIYRGRYCYNILIKKISIAQFLSYIIGCIVIIGGVKLAIQFFYDAFYVSFRNIDSTSILEDDYWLDYSENVKMIFATYGRLFFSYMEEVYKICYSFFFVLGIGMIWCLLQIKPKFITNFSGNTNEKDFFDLYISLLLKLTRSCDLLAKHFIRSLKEYKWIAIRQIYQIVIMNYESITYIVIIIFVIAKCNNDVVRTSLLMVLNIQVISNQAYELRSVLASFFSFRNNNEELFFFKMYFNNYEIYKEKECVMRTMLIIPTVVVIVLEVGMVFFCDIKVKSIIIAMFTLGVYYLICPIIQTHMLPYTTDFSILGKQLVGESSMEDDLADAMQAGIRNFTNIIPIMFTIVIIILRRRNRYILALEIFYLLIMGPLTVFYCRKISKRGLKVLYDKIR